MPKRRTQFAPGCYYHIYNRGVGRQPIFVEEKNYLFVLRRLKQVAHECQVSVLAYCLLPNHYHWLLRQDGDTPAGAVPSRVFVSYSQAFNRAYQRSGFLFEGPYQSIRVDTDAYLHRLCCYIHANPVRHGIVSDLEAWPYSNYLEWIGKRNGTLVDHQFVRGHFCTNQSYETSVKSLITGEVVLPPRLQDYMDKLEQGD